MLIRTSYVWSVGFIVTIALFPFALAGFFIGLPFGLSGNFVHAIGSFWAGIIVSLSGVKVDIKGIENIPPPPFILMSNHKGAFDIPVLQAKLPIQYRWIARKGLFTIPVIGWAMRLAGYIPIDRGNSKSAYRSIEEGAGRIKNGVSVLIFPEGGRNETEELLPFKRGGVLLAEKSGVPIVPISIRGTEKIMPMHKYSMSGGPVKVRIGQPIETKDKDGARLTQEVKAAIEKGLGSI